MKPIHSYYQQSLIIYYHPKLLNLPFEWSSQKQKNGFNFLVVISCRKLIG
jgi:hypothetical protein